LAAATAAIFFAPAGLSLSTAADNDPWEIELHPVLAICHDMGEGLQEVREVLFQGETVILAIYYKVDARQGFFCCQRI
jgi:hypothetical protein